MHFQKTEESWQPVSDAKMNTTEFKTVPALVVGFKRHRQLRQCLSQLSESAVQRVYVSIDAPRNPSEFEDSREIRNILDEFENRFEIIRRFADSNQGCRAWVSSSISWFFEHEDFGIILEEDILLDKRFVDWCSILRDQPALITAQVMHINAFFPETQDLRAAGPTYTRYPTSWGWATWRDAWRLYDDAMVGFRDTHFFERVRLLRKLVGCGWLIAIHYALALEMADQDKLSSWAYRWNLSIWRNQGICLSPGVNLSENIGFGSGATHTSKEGLDKYKITSGKENISIKINPLDLDLDKKVFFRVTKANSLIRTVRMFVSVLVPNRLFFFLRKMFRN